MGDGFEKRLHEHCKSICIPTKMAPKPRPKSQEEVSARLKLLESINHASSDSEISKGNEDNGDEDNNKGDDNKGDDGENDDNKGDDGENDDNSKGDKDNGKGDDNKGDDKDGDDEDDTKCGRDGATVGGLFRDDDNSEDKDEEPRHVFTQRRKRQRITSCEV